RAGRAGDRDRDDRYADRRGNQRRRGATVWHAQECAGRRPHTAPRDGRSRFLTGARGQPHSAASRRNMAFAIPRNRSRHSTAARTTPRNRLALPSTTRTSMTAPDAGRADASANGRANAHVEAAVAAVQLDGVTKTFGDNAVGRRVAQSIPGAGGTVPIVAVDHVDLEVRNGEFFSMLGPSGS